MRIFTILLPCLASLAAAATVLLPEPQELSWQPGKFVPASSVSIRLPSGATEALRHVAGAFAAALAIESGLPAQIAPEAAPDGRIEIGTAPETGTPPESPEGYALTVAPTGVAIAASDDAGLFYGMQTLRQLLQAEGALPAVRIRDWPDQAIRPVSMGFERDPKSIVEAVARSKCNMIIMESRWYGPGNWWYNPVNSNLHEFQEFAELCRLNNIELIPLVQGLGWAYGVVTINPHCVEGVMVEDRRIVLAGTAEAEIPDRNVIRTEAAPVTVRSADRKTVYTEGTDYRIIPGRTERHFLPSHEPWKIARVEGSAIPDGATVSLDYNYMTPTTHQTPYCPSEPDTYKLVDHALESAVKMTRPRFIHIGHDEVIYKNRCSRCRNSGKSEAELMLDDIRYWHRKIKELSPETEILMWDDLVRPDSELHRQIFAGLPPDIILCPWRYGYDADTQQDILDSIAYYRQHGFRVLGTCAGYYPENPLLWRQAAQVYRDDPGYLGSFFSHWGDGEMNWGSMPFAAAQMWNNRNTGEAELQALAAADRRTNAMPLRIALSLDRQLPELADQANRLLDRGVTAERDTFASGLEALAAELDALAPDSPPAVAGAADIAEVYPLQLRRLAALFRAMLLYGEIAAGATGKELPERLQQELARAQCPEAEAAFPALVHPLAPVRIDGLRLPVAGAHKLRENIWDLGREYRLGALALQGAARAIPAVSYGLTPEQLTPAKTVPQPRESGVTLFFPEPLPARYVGIAADAVTFDSVKPLPEIAVPQRSGDWKSDAFWDKIPWQGDFAVASGAASAYGTRFRCAWDDAGLYFDAVAPYPAGAVRSEESPDNSWPMWSEDTLTFFLRPDRNTYDFRQLGVNSSGHSICYVSGADAPDREVPREVVSTIDAEGTWHLRLKIPAAWLPGMLEAGRNCGFNLGRIMNNPAEMSSWTPLPDRDGSWFVQPVLWGQLQLEPAPHNGF